MINDTAYKIVEIDDADSSRSSHTKLRSVNELEVASATSNAWGASVHDDAHDRGDVKLSGRRRRRVPLLMVFAVLPVASFVGIVALGLVLGTRGHKAALSTADSALRTGLDHAAEVTLAPFREAEAVALRMALITNQSGYRAVNEAVVGMHRNAPDFHPIEGRLQDIVAVTHSSRGQMYAIYIQQRIPREFLVGTSDYETWSYMGCILDINLCMTYGVWNASRGVPVAGHLTTAASMPLNLSATVWSGDWNYTDQYYFTTEARALSYGAVVGQWGREPDVWFAPGEQPLVLISFHVPVEFDPETRRAIVVESVDLSAGDLSRFLRKVKLPGAELALILGHSEMVLASTFSGVPESDATVRGTAEKPVMWTVQTVPNARLRDSAALVSAMTDRSDDTVTAMSPEPDSLTAHVVAASRLTLRGGLELWLVLAVPRTLFFKEIDMLPWYAGIIGSICALIAVAVAIGLVYAIERPISRLGAAMGPASRLQLNSAEFDAGGRSVLRELAALEDAFLVMNAQLQEAGAFLPPAIKARWVVDGGEEFVSDSASAEESGPGSPEYKNAASDRSCLQNSINTGSSASSAKVDAGALGGSKRMGASPLVPPRGSEGVISAAHAASFATGSSVNSGVVSSKRTVAVLQINVVGFSRIVDCQNMAAVQRASQRLTDAVVNAVVEHRGVVDGFQGDRFTVTFNAAIPCGSSALRALHAGLGIADAVQTMREDAGVSCGVAAGRSLVGDIGCKGLRRQGVIGSAIGQATVLERLARGLVTGRGGGAGELASLAAAAASVRSLVVIGGGSVGSDVQTHYPLVPLDFVRLPGSEVAEVISAVGPAFEQTGDEEWMYALERRQGQRMSKAGLLSEDVLGVFEVLSAAARRATRRELIRPNTPAGDSVLTALRAACSVARTGDADKSPSGDDAPGPGGLPSPAQLVAFTAAHRQFSLSQLRSMALCDGAGDKSLGAKEIVCLGRPLGEFYETFRPQ